MAKLVAQRPIPPSPRPFAFPSFTQARLSSGMHVRTVDIPGRPLAAVYLVLEAGALNEPAGREGVAALAARALTEGSERYGATEFAEAVEALGADLVARAGWETIVVSSRVPVARVEQVLELVAEATRRPSFAEPEIDRLRAERVNAIRQALASPMQRALWAFIGSTYDESSRFSRPAEGVIDSVSALTRDDVAEHYGRFATPGSATLVVAGDLRGTDVVGACERLFGDWSVGEPERPRPAVKERIAQTHVSIVHRPGSVQSNFVLGHGGIARSAPDYHAVELLEHVLGGSFMSRINQKLREEKGYTYGARGTFDARRQPGPFYAYAPVETSVTAPAIADAVAEIRRMRDEGAREEEVDDARTFLTGAFGLRFETPDAIAAGLVELALYELSDDYFDTYGDALSRLTADDVSRAARDHLRPDGMAIAIVGDADAITEPLRAAGFADVEVTTE
ncbi:MAG TPA: pitrilysin family protein [Actinomycetota bacterium]|nr:pitrilysin family protein [Actinomycetota bacterium]